MEEIWREIPGLEGKYQVSSNRNIRSLDRIVLKNNGVSQRVNGQFIKVETDRNGYNIVRLKVDNCKTKHFLMSHIVALSFPELIQNEYFEGAEIDHINTIRTDDRPENLRWVDRKTNLANPLSKEHQRQAQNPKWVIKLNDNNEILHFYQSARQAERETGIDNSRIYDCLNGKRKTAGGYIWKYTE